MLTICSVQLTFDETSLLVSRLDDDHTLLSDEVAAAIRYAVAAHVGAECLGRDFEDAISHALHDPLPAGLAALRAALDRGDRGADQSPYRKPRSLHIGRVPLEH